MAKLDGATLTGVSETALLTLWHRGGEAARSGSFIEDPHAVRLLESIDYPYREHFGAANQFFAMRALAFDGVIRDFLREHPDGTVVALAEGLQTSYWRLGRPSCQWISVDLPPVAALRDELFPKEEHVQTVGASALEPAWMDRVDPGAPVLITAEGLLYYLDEPVALGLIEDCAARFPGGRFLFDSVPRWWAARKNKGFGTVSAVTGQLGGKPAYVLPPMPFALSPARINTFPDRIPGVESVRAISPPPGRGLAGRAVQSMYRRSPIPSRLRFTISELRFSPSTQR